MREMLDDRRRSCPSRAEPFVRFVEKAAPYSIRLKELGGESVRLTVGAGLRTQQDIL